MVFSTHIPNDSAPRVAARFSTGELDQFVYINIGPVDFFIPAAVAAQLHAQLGALLASADAGEAAASA